MAIKEWKPEFSNSNEVAPEQPSNLKVEESKNTQETWKPNQFDLKKAINNADDDVLDAQFGKDTPERKLAGAMKTKPQMSDYDLFKSIHYTPSDKGRPNYVEGEEEEMWNKLGEHFDLPKYESNKYSFLVNDKDKSVRLSTRGESDGLGFGGWKEKPQDLGQLKRKPELKGDKASIRGTVRQSEMPEEEASMDDIKTYLGENRDYFDPESTIENVAYEVADAVGGQPQQVLDLLKKEAESYGLKFDPYANYKQWWEKEEQLEKQKEATSQPKPQNKVNLNDAFNNAGLPQFVGKDVNAFSKDDIRKIKDQIAKNDSYYKENWKDNPQRKALVDIVNNYAETYRNPSLFIDENEITNYSALSNYLKKNVSQSEYDENVFETEDGEEYLVVDEDKARQYAEDDIRSTIDDLGLQAFSRNFQDWIVNNAIDSNWLEQIKEEEADYFENEGDQETAERYRNMSDDELIDELKGMYGEQDFASFVGENIDWNKVIDEAISWDGIAHFIARYDGKEIELPNGLYAYRIN